MCRPKQHLAISASDKIQQTDRHETHEKKQYNLAATRNASYYIHTVQLVWKRPVVKL